MKKTKVITAALMAAVISAGAGYAAWTDSLNIKGTVNNAEMKVEFVDTSLLLNHKYPFAKDLELGNKYVDAKVAIQDPKTVTVNLSKLYPGTGMLYAARFDNKGTIPAVIDKVEVNFTQDNQLLKDNLVVVGGFVHLNKNDIPVDGGIFPNLKDGIFGKKIYLKDLEDNLNKALVGQRLEKGDYITLDIPEEDKNQVNNVLKEQGIEGFDPANDNCVIMGLPSSAKNELKNQTAVFEIKLHFKQFNEIAKK